MLSRVFTLFSSASCFGLGAAVLLAGHPAAASPVPAGTLIETTAEATYDEGGVARTVSSNTVQVRVDELLSVAAASLDAGPVPVRSGPAVLAFLVSNSGNGPEAVVLEVVTAVPGNAFDATRDSIAVDTNDNGVYDPGVDAVLPAPSTTATLPAGAAQRVFVIVTVPTGIGDGAQSALNLIARTTTGSGAPGTVFAGAGDNGADAMAGAGGGMATATGQMVGSASTVTLVKWASVSDPFGGSTAAPGATITYGISASVSGSAPVDTLVISDAIPAGTRYVPGSLNLDSAPLTDAVGDDPGEASPAGIAVTLGTVPGGTSRTVTFAVLIEE
ncbi:MAG: DUF11 domain-containing protein [Sphingomonadales bacterium]|nr:DUF11 domain-containing protein [Sphingomonadales bacterium]NCQ21775.1 DUF11 domain-containing protein [Sphingomonadales bacterium]NCT04487.1 DUF11 domain-containing protein [Sphingomonadales bacterium]